MKNNNIPAIRFKGFTEAWEQCKLGELGSTYTGLSGKTKEDFGHGDGKFITYMNVFSNPISNIEMVEPIEIDVKQNTVLSGDIFFTTSSETPEEVGMASVLVENPQNMYLNSFCFGYRPNIKLDPYYMGYMLRSTDFRKNMILLAQGISRYNISKTKAMELNVSIPVLEEQSKIGLLFKELNNLITLHQRKYEKLINIKKSLLEKMFPSDGESIPKIRFRGFAEAWEQRKYSDIAIIKRGLTYSPNNITNDGIRVLRSSNINDDQFVIYEDDVFVNPNAVNIDKVENGDILITSANGSPRLVGKHAIIRDLKENSAVHGGFMLISRAANYEFVNASMSSNWYREFLSVNVAGGNGAIGNLNATELENYELLIPINNEQIKIGELFSRIDSLITLHQRKYEKLKNIKKSLLNKMFV